MLLYGTNGWIHLSIGRADRWFRWTIVELAVTAGLFLLGLRWGPAGVAVACVASYWILSIPAPVVCGPAGPSSDSARHRRGVEVRRGVRARGRRHSRGPACDAGLRSSSPAPWERSCGSRCVSSVFGVLYLGAVILLHRGFAPMSQLSALLREMIPRAAICEAIRGRCPMRTDPDRRRQRERAALCGPCCRPTAPGTSRSACGTTSSRRAAGTVSIGRPATASTRMSRRYASNGSILDLGCGSGSTGNELDPAAYERYVGVDISDVAIAKAQQRTEENRRTDRNSYRAVRHLQLRAEPAFDVILFRESIYYVPRGRSRDAPAVRAVSRGRRRLHRQDGGCRQVPGHRGDHRNPLRGRRQARRRRSESGRARSFRLPACGWQIIHETKSFCFCFLSACAACRRCPSTGRCPTCHGSHAQASSSTTEVLDPARRIDWSQAGVPGGIPHRATGTLRHARPERDGGRDQQRHCRLRQRRRLSECRNLQPVGRHHLQRRQQRDPPRRWSRPDTILKFTGTDPCGGLHANVCIIGWSRVWSGNVPAGDIRNWTAGYGKGTTQITLDSTAGMTVGMRDRARSAERHRGRGRRGRQRRDGPVLARGRRPRPCESRAAAVRPGDRHRRRSRHDISRPVHAELAGQSAAAGLVVGRDRGPERRRRPDARSLGKLRDVRHRVSECVQRLGQERQVAERQAEPCLAESGRAHRSSRQLFPRDQDRGVAELRRRVVHLIRRSRA